MQLPRSAWHLNDKPSADPFCVRTGNERITRMILNLNNRYLTLEIRYRYNNGLKWPVLVRGLCLFGAFLTLIDL